MSPSSTEERVKAIAEKVAIDQGLELVHAEVAGPENKPIVRIFIDKPAGVTHQDCSAVVFTSARSSMLKTSSTLPIRWKFRRLDWIVVFISGPITSGLPAVWQK